MTLVDYPSSSSGSENDGHKPENQNPLKRKRSLVQPEQHKSSAAKDELPPLPSSFHDLYASAARTSSHDDPSLHGGRKRSVPHIQGNWPSHVYLEWYPSPAELILLSNVTKHVESQSQLCSLLQSDLGTPRPLHISLSQPLNLETQQRQQFLSTLSSRIRAPAALTGNSSRRQKNEPKPPPENHVGPFTTSFSSLHWFPNQSNDRWFLVLRLEKPANDELCRLLETCNSTATAFGQSGLYVEKQAARQRRAKGSSAAPAENLCSGLGYGGDCFHVSIAWSLGPPHETVLPSAQSISSPLHSGAQLENALAEVRKLKLRFDSVKVKIGNEVHSVELSERVGENSRSILG